MWIIYIVIAVILSTGAGVYLSRDVNVQIDDTARIQAPQIHAQQANQVARYLRRLYLDDASLFPPIPSSGETLIPDNLVQEALLQGNTVPPGTVFVLRSDGLIVPVFAPDPANGDLRDSLLADSFNRVIETDGVNPHLYGRRSGVMDRTFVETITPIIPGENDPTNTPPRPITINPDGANPDIDDSGNETTDGEGQDGGDPLEDLPPVTGGGDPGNGDQGGSGGDTEEDATDEDGFQTDDDLEETDFELTLEQLLENNGSGGSGGSTPIDPDSFFIDANGTLFVAEGYESLNGPRAPVFTTNDAQDLFDQIAAERVAGTFERSNYLRGLFFEANNYEASERAEKEARFSELCERIVLTLSEDFEATLEATIASVLNAVESKRDDCDRVFGGPDQECLEQYPNETIQEDIGNLATAYGGAASYCMSVMRARQADFPVRANRASSTNDQLLTLAVNYIDNEFLPRAWYLTNTDIAPRTPMLNIIESLIASTRSVKDVVDTYIPPPEPPAPEPEPEPEPDEDPGTEDPVDEPPSDPEPEPDPEPED